jgi:Zn-dependent peptidase ImmA (M78 family)
MKKTTVLSWNKNRLEYLLDAFGMSLTELVDKINLSRPRKPIEASELTADRVRISVLKSVDRLFKKGLFFYLMEDVKYRENKSVFFRKEKFNAELDFYTKSIVMKHEEDLALLSSYAAICDIETGRTLKKFTTKADPAKVAMLPEIAALRPNKIKKEKQWIENLCNKLADVNIDVREISEPHNRKDKLSVNGFFIAPNLIVSKYEGNRRRQAFTIAHELGHYLLESEDFDLLNDANAAGTNKVENWCNDFAFYFLAGENASLIEKSTVLKGLDATVELVDRLYELTMLSKAAICYRLMKYNRITRPMYSKALDRFDKRTKEEKIEGIRHYTSATPIISPYLSGIVKVAYDIGAVELHELPGLLHTRPKIIRKYIRT